MAIEKLSIRTIGGGAVVDRASLGLFNADSGQWDVAMRNAVKTFLLERIEGLPIFA